LAGAAGFFADPAMASSSLGTIFSKMTQQPFS
jgi:hypothetical protein